MQIFFSKGFILLLLTAIIPSLVNAHPFFFENNEKNALYSLSPIEKLPAWYLDIGLGWMFDQKLGANYIDNIELPRDTLVAPKGRQAPFGSLLGGYMWSGGTTWLPFISLGLEYSFFYPSKTSGIIEDYSEPEEANHSYQYKISHHNLQLIGKFALARWQNWLPYVAGGIGGSWNRVDGYDEQVITDRVSEHVNPQFPNNTTLDLSYSVSAGFDYVLNKLLWLGIGYRFDRFGKMTTGDSLIHNIYHQDHLSKSLKAHSLFFSLRYIFG